uniref:BMA-MYO-5 n=1 Tax=Brugia malayi TaxID=6279 RepID=A0A0H5S890_BRUMA|nr:BMA-MYO-5 [Brugia malayi]
MSEYESNPGWQYLRQRQQQVLITSKKFDSKKNVWVPDEEEGFIAAEIKSTKDDFVTLITCKGVEKTLKKDETRKMNPPKYEKTEDMANLTFLSDASVLHNLRERYLSMMIYTYSGLFCVVINPYKRLPIYTENICEMYIGKRRSEMPPHLFAVSDEAYRNMINDHRNQSMLITGESGAGKTENTKKVIAYLAIVGAPHLSNKSEKNRRENASSIEDQIVRTNPVLEAFGNAKTVRNNNSSRFGKFIRIHFNAGGRLAGADIEHYLLEKSRVIKQAPGERCYHIFYQIMSGQIAGLKEKLFLTREIKDYHLISQAEVTIDDEEMRITDESFDIMHFTEQEKQDLFALVAGIIHMGEIKFKQRQREEQAECEDHQEGDLACKLWMVNTNNFISSLLKPRVKVGLEWVSKGQNLEQVNWAVGALAKAIYARMFAWLIKRCNKTLDAQDRSRDYFIGVLDIAGFEIFDFNSFEQLWINFVNEKLQQFFNHHMFVLEQQEYQREGIRWEFIDFGLDLQACIELIEKPLGIISMLDEECIVPKASDFTLAQKVNDQHLGKHPNFQKPKPPKGKQASAHLAIVHYAGTVRYNVTDWLEKNKDPLNDTAVGVLKANAGMVLMTQIWEDYKTQEDMTNLAKEGKTSRKKGKSSSFMTVSMIYRESLNNLMTMLYKTYPHFIRCIIPNEKKQSGVIEASLVLNQLICNGVLEGIRICRKGFPNRTLHANFKQRYAILATEDASSEIDLKQCVVKMCATLERVGTLKPEDYCVGNTKVFFKAGIFAQLEKLRDEALSIIITKFQNACRHYQVQCDLRCRMQKKAAVLLLQRNIRVWCTLRNWNWFKLYGLVKLLIKGSKKDEEFEALQRKAKELEENFNREKQLRKDKESEVVKLVTEKQQLFLQLEQEKDISAEGEERAAKLLAQKIDAEKQFACVKEQLAEQEDRNAILSEVKSKIEYDNEVLKSTVAELEATCKKLDQDKQVKDHQLRSLQDEIKSQDEIIAKTSKEKKCQEEISRKLLEEIQVGEDKLNHLNKVRNKLEQTIDEIEENLERERRVRQDIEKSKRKAEGELKIAQENVEEFMKQKHEMENALKKKDTEIASMLNRIDDEQSSVNKIQRQLKEQIARYHELEEELQTERQAKLKIERSRSEMQKELEELSDRLDEAGGATQAQIELNKKREAELAKLRRDLEEVSLNAETAIANLRKKHNDAMVELSGELDSTQKERIRMEKEKGTLQREIDTLRNQCDMEAKQRQNADRFAKQLEAQLADTQLKVDEQVRNLQESIATKNKLQTELSLNCLLKIFYIEGIFRQLEDCQNQIAFLNRTKQQLTAQLEEVKRQLEQESHEKHSLNTQLSSLQLECQQLRDAMDEELDSKTELQRLISKANSEVQQWRARYEGEGMSRSEELEEARRKLQAKVQEMQEALDAANSRINSLEKTRLRLAQELEDAQIDADKANSFANSLDKKQKVFDKTVEEWKRKCDMLTQELEASQREVRGATTEAFRLRSTVEETAEQVETLRRENKVLTEELKDVTDQLGEGGKSLHELQKQKRKLEMEKNELQQALDDAESALEIEENKVLRAQIEISQIRSEIEKRITEKEEEFQNTRNNHQRTLESMQASLETETRGRADLLRMKKKLESDITELEVALDHANRTNVDAQKTIKRHQDNVRELQTQIEDEQRQRDELREQMNVIERRIQILQSEKEELSDTLEQAERNRRQTEQEAADIKEAVNSLTQSNYSLSATKRKLESEIQQLHSELNETFNELKNTDERCKKAVMDAGKLAEELQTEQEHSQNLERQRKGLESQMKEMQARLDDVETTALKDGKRILTKLDQRVHDLEIELADECRRHAETLKNYRNRERKVRELQFQVDEDKKNSERMYDLIEKMQTKIKTYKRQIEEAEQLATQNIGKYRQMQHMLEDAEERADTAENSLVRIRARNRFKPQSVGGRIAHSVPFLMYSIKLKIKTKNFIFQIYVRETFLDNSVM